MIESGTSKNIKIPKINKDLLIEGMPPLEFLQLQLTRRETTEPVEINSEEFDQIFLKSALIIQKQFENGMLEKDFIGVEEYICQFDNTDPDISFLRGLQKQDIIAQESKIKYKNILQFIINSSLLLSHIARADEEWLKLFAKSLNLPSRDEDIEKMKEIKQKKPITLLKLILRSYRKNNKIESGSVVDIINSMIEKLPFMDSSRIFLVNYINDQGEEVTKPAVTHTRQIDNTELVLIGSGGKISDKTGLTNNTSQGNIITTSPSIEFNSIILNDSEIKNKFNTFLDEMEIHIDKLPSEHKNDVFYAINRVRLQMEQYAILESLNVGGIDYKVLDSDSMQKLESFTKVQPDKEFVELATEVYDSHLLVISELDKVYGHLNLSQEDYHRLQKPINTSLVKYYLEIHRNDRFNNFSRVNTINETNERFNSIRDVKSSLDSQDYHKTLNQFNKINGDEYKIIEYLDIILSNKDYLESNLSPTKAETIVLRNYIRFTMNKLYTESYLLSFSLLVNYEKLLSKTNPELVNSLLKSHLKLKPEKKKKKLSKGFGLK